MNFQLDNIEFEKGFGEIMKQADVAPQHFDTASHAVMSGITQAGFHPINAFNNAMKNRAI